MNGVEGMRSPEGWDEPVAGRLVDERVLPFEFTGLAGEYFRIWIVNAALSVLTLGIYSAWAKVRTRTYFYRNTHLEGATFEYLADPLRILKGRLIVATVLGAMYASEHYSPVLYGILALVVVISMPFVFVAGLAFNARYSAYRNVRFAFASSVATAYLTWFGVLAIYILTLGIGVPYAQWVMTRYIVQSHRYGAHAFRWNTIWNDYYGVYFAALFLAVPIVICGLMIIGLVAHENGSDISTMSYVVPVVVLVMYGVAVALGGFMKARFANLTLGGIRIGPHFVRSDQRGRDMMWIFSSNAVAIVCSAGLLIPWAMIRLARYRAAHTRIYARGPLLAENVDQRGEGIGFVGDAATDLGGIDFDLGF